MFTNFDVKVKYNVKTVLRGTQCAHTGLWLVPLQTKTTQEAESGVLDPVTNLFLDLKLHLPTQELNSTHMYGSQRIHSTQY